MTKGGNINVLVRGEFMGKGMPVSPSPSVRHQRGGERAAAARHAKQSLSTVSTTFCTSGP